MPINPIPPAIRLVLSALTPKVGLTTWTQSRRVFRQSARYDLVCQSISRFVGKIARYYRFAIGYGGFDGRAGYGLSVNHYLHSLANIVLGYFANFCAHGIKDKWTT